MPGIDNVVSINISRSTKTVTRAGFGIPLILGQHSRFLNSDKIRYYSSLAAVLSDGFLTSDAEYKAAAAAFGQEIKPAKVAIGKRIAAVAQVVTWTPTVQNNTAYTVTINGVLHSYTSDADATANEIVAGLIALINGGSQAPKVTASGTTTLIVTADAAGEPFTYTQSANLAAVLTTPNWGVQEDIQAVIESSSTGNDWYCLILTSRTDLDILLAAGKIETLKKLFLACSGDTNIIGASTSDIASQLKAKTYARTSILYSADQANYPEAAWAGRVLPLDPGSETWKFKTLAGITFDNLTDNQLANADSKYANYYVQIGGISMTSPGKVSANEWIDVIRFIDWLESTMAADVFTLLVNADKVPYTDAGIGQIESLVRGALQKGVRVGGLSDYSVEVPKYADIATNDKQARHLPDVKFDGTLAGAIHDVSITGQVSV